MSSYKSWIVLFVLLSILFVCICGCYEQPKERIINGYYSIKINSDTISYTTIEIDNQEYIIFSNYDSMFVIKKEYPQIEDERLFKPL